MTVVTAFCFFSYATAFGQAEIIQIPSNTIEEYGITKIEKRYWKLSHYKTDTIGTRSEIYERYLFDVSGNLIQIVFPLDTAGLFTQLDFNYDSIGKITSYYRSVLGTHASGDLIPLNSYGSYGFSLANSDFEGWTKRFCLFHPSIPFYDKSYNYTNELNSFSFLSKKANPLLTDDQKTLYIKPFGFFSGCSFCYKWTDQVYTNDTTSGLVKEISNVYQGYSSSPGNTEAGCYPKIDVVAKEITDYKVANLIYDSFNRVYCEELYDLINNFSRSLYFYKDKRLIIKGYKRWVDFGDFRLDYKYYYSKDN